ncbi:DUF7678 domain-containing protein [Priestia megaterium]|uniref:DUF7678 domain-containing protein n=1 Tax=Priestia megaterium TaxID=1404 RepID=UPI0023DAD3BD|nr:hypothetical protein [Priestia megaterium]MDF2015544.1 hypothetical protein [Priestia megaterium]
MNTICLLHSRETGEMAGVAKDGKYNFSAMKLKQPSNQGIDGSGLVKLEVEEANTNKIIISYDRSWNIQPQAQDEIEVYETIVKFLKGHK